MKDVILWCVVLLVVVCVTSVLVAIAHPWWIQLSVAVLGFLATTWIILSLKIVGPDEMAVRVYSGTPVAVCDSGFHFVPWFFGLTYLVRYPKKIYSLNYDDIEVITIAKEYPIGSGQVYGATKVKVNAAEYLNFPRPETPIEPGETAHPLIKILRADVPKDDAGLQKWTREAVESAVRLAFGQVTWKQAAEDLKAISRAVEVLFKDGNNTLVKAGFRDPGIKLVVSKIVLPPDVEAALTEPEKARLRAEAASKDAEAQAIDRLETILYCIARSEGVDVSVIKERVRGDKDLQRELLNYAESLHADIEKADRGAYFKLESSGNPLLDAVTLWKQMTSGGGSNTPTGKPSGNSGQGGGQQGSQSSQGGKQQTHPPMSVDEARKFFEQQFGYKPNW